MLKWVVDYYDKNSELILPFLKERKIGIRQIFNGEIIYRRHEPNSRNWIYVNEKDDLMRWVKWHGWAYFPHLETDNELWFAMDIDSRKVNFEGVKIVASVMVNILNGLKIKYLVKFSGSNGFHFLWRYKKPLSIKDKIFIHSWQFERATIEFLQTRLEQNLQNGKHKNYLYSFSINLTPSLSAAVMTKKINGLF